MSSKRLLSALPLALVFSLAAPGIARAQSNLYNGHKPDINTPPRLVLIPENQQQPVRLSDDFPCPADLPSPCIPKMRLIGDARGQEFLFLGFEQPSEDQTGPTRAILSGTIMRKTGDYTFVPVARITQGSVYTYTSPSIHNINDQAVLDIKECAHYCESQLFILKEGQWQSLAPDDSWENVYYMALLPNYSPGSPYPFEYNEKGMRMEIPLRRKYNQTTGDFDPMSSASGIIKLDLSIKDSRMHVDKAVLETGQQFDIP